MTADAVNAAFELGGALAIVLSIRRLRRDKRVAGYDPMTLAFFTLWGFWNLWFYGPAMGAWLSWWAGIAVVAANCAYLALLVWYSRHPGGRSLGDVLDDVFDSTALEKMAAEAYDERRDNFNAALAEMRRETRRLLS